jgi:hypothetical protein
MTKSDDLEKTKNLMGALVRMAKAARENEGWKEGKEEALLGKNRRLGSVLFTCRELGRA